VEPQDVAVNQADWADVDPLYDPAFPIFVYAGWALADAAWGDTAGLYALVLGTATLSLLSLLQERGPEPRTFLAEFSIILLYCAAALSTGVLALQAL